MSIEEALLQLEQQQKLQVEDVFTPNLPSTKNFFCGRENEVLAIIEGIISSKANLLVYGDRGIGKTSLAKYSCGILSDRFQIQNHYYSCSEESSFETVMSVFFADLKIDIEDTITTTKRIEGSVGFKGILGANTSGEETAEVITKRKFEDVSWVAKKLKNAPNIILLIDEFDKIKNSNEKGKFATLMKLLSDYESAIKLIVVGVAHDAGELMDGHESVVRCLREVGLPRMAQEELLEILTRGQERLGITFENNVRNHIVADSDGFPYFTHLLALETVKVAISQNKKTANINDYKQGVSNAVCAQDNALQKKISDVLSNKNEETQKKLLIASAMIGNLEFTSIQWKDKYTNLFGENIEQGKVNSLMVKAIKDDNSSVYRRLTQGRYFFVDPRMPIYIKLKYANRGDKKEVL